MAGVRRRGPLQATHSQATPGALHPPAFASGGLAAGARAVATEPASQAPHPTYLEGDGVQVIHIWRLPGLVQVLLHLVRHNLVEGVRCLLVLLQRRNLRAGWEARAWQEVSRAAAAALPCNAGGALNLTARGFRAALLLLPASGPTAPPHPAPSTCASVMRDFCSAVGLASSSTSPGRSTVSPASTKRYLPVLWGAV